ncbi:protein of unknown function DUF214 [Fibrisoma limi BUZ 3]|uniref:Macrolide export ATP-binding/permease protein macB n=1 Tax=Fibrisoma limi BUZ 3 TaxID=1185876 RepID=I2GGF3_9BACT|nr:ABC transporter permease [Fibrisoma limi]CCH52978.1 protein of unknown function DUF214 [Fibrisoma limi BUZ 3]
MNKPSPNPTPRPQESAEHRHSARRPPRWADRLLSWLTPAELLEELQGDLQERFAQRVDQVGPRRARWGYGLEALKVIRPYYLRRRVASLVHRQKSFFSKRPDDSHSFYTLNYPSPPLMNPTMLRNYVKIAVRNGWKHRLFSVINIVGLAAGMLVCLVMLTQIKGSFDYDDFHPNRDRIYRVLTDAVDAQQNRAAFATSPLPLADVLRREWDFVEQVTRVVRLKGEITVHHKRFDKVLTQAVDNGFFRLFGYPLAAGQAATAPNTVVLTHETAERFFGRANPLGQRLDHAEAGPLTVVGVLAPLPTKSHLRFDALVCVSLAQQERFRQPLADWRQYGMGYTYVLLKAGTPAQTLQTALTSLARRVVRNGAFNAGRATYRDERAYTFRAQPLTALSPSFETLGFPTYEPQLDGLLFESGIGLLTLLLAVFNYVNLTLARSLGRAREVGIRKVMGALGSQLRGQFMAESVLLSMLALGLAWVGLQVIKPMATLQKYFIGGVAQDGRMWTIFVGFALGAGLLAGWVPARVLSRFEPAVVLRSRTGLNVLRGLSVRKSLIVVQFTITLIGVIFLLTFYRQQRFMVEADYGFRRSGVLTLPLQEVPLQRLQDELTGLAGVERVSPTSAMLGHYGGDWVMLRAQRRGPDSSRASLVAADAEFVPAMQLSLLAGRNLPANDPNGRFVLLNETAVRNLSGRGPVDARSMVGRQLWLNDTTVVEVAGILRDFKFMTLGEPVYPLVLRQQPEQFRYLNVAVVPGQEAAVLAAVRQRWQRLHPYEKTFSGQWYDDYLEQRHGHREELNLVSLLIGLALSIAGLGLLGVVTYQTETRTKEVGIRKVMGATVAQVVGLLSWDFVKLLGLAALIALPVGYGLGLLLLNNFAYRVSIGLETLGVCVALLLLVGGATVGWRTYRAALANPADILRAE